MDAKDILGLPKTPLSLPHEKKSRPKESQRKPDGIHREVYALTGGVPPPLMPSIELSQLKRRPQSEEKITWQWLPFSNSARKDDLKLYHWVRIVNGVVPTGDYSFAKYNKSVDIVKYTDEEYEKYLINPMWTKKETSQLFELCERFDLRFVVIADRFSPPRPVEELKNRYYSVVRAVLLARATSPADVADHPLVKEPYDVTREIEHKRALSMVLSHSKHQERKDSEILAEAKRIAQARAAARAAENPEPPIQFSKGPDNTEKAPTLSEAISPSDQLLSSSVVPTPPVIDTSATLASLRMLKVYLRSYALDQMVQATSASAGLRTIKRVEQTLQDLGINFKPRVPTKVVCDEHLELRNDILTLLNLQKQLQHKDAEGVAYGDGSHADAPAGLTQTNFVGDSDRSFMAEPLIFRAEPVVKKDHKRKGPGRPNESPSSPAQSIKRPRKLKAND